jgi:hypothetical protein
MPSAEQIERGVTAHEMANELLWYDESADIEYNGGRCETGFVLSEGERVFLERVFDSGDLPTQAEWERILEIGRRYCRAEKDARK